MVKKSSCPKISGRTPGLFRNMGLHQPLKMVEPTPRPSCATYLPEIPLFFCSQACNAVTSGGRTQFLLIAIPLHGKAIDQEKLAR